MNKRPNAPRVRGAGPARKTLICPKACEAPHPLQPIVRPRLRRSYPRPDTMPFTKELSSYNDFNDLGRSLELLWPLDSVDEPKELTELNELRHYGSVHLWKTFNQENLSMSPVLVVVRLEGADATRWWFTRLPSDGEIVQSARINYRVSDVMHYAFENHKPEPDRPVGEITLRT